MSITRTVYLLLAIFGLVMTWYYNLQFIAESGGSFDVTEFIAAGATNATHAMATYWCQCIALKGVHTNVHATSAYCFRRAEGPLDIVG